MCPSLLDPLLCFPLPDPGFRCTSLHLPLSRDTEDGNEVVSPLQPLCPTLVHKQEEERTPLHLGTGVGMLSHQHTLQWVWIQAPTSLPPSFTPH